MKLSTKASDKKVKSMQTPVETLAESKDRARKLKAQPQKNGLAILGKYWQPLSDG